ncbi:MULTISPECIES: hypothetical protein [unclassified Pseudonocardia]|jgi:hypothetical protein|uniref:hypothetical protein n=1 Tax=unclassified Pseudonocardia TaxID=2619320 RepID=UPI0009612042|nr:MULTISPECIES: hypothetical protein [unclassified Pseudonocardia]MBN9100774.1 hypothetical protein [Pseudonocardia sp.]OJY44129.1 MAG: hypothetical protein BGP03_07270 [Pseudonocardia sp. 73-21]
MDSYRKGRDTRPFELFDAIPQQRRPADRRSILADDQLIEDIRCDRIIDDGAAPPLVQMLVRWRRQAMAGT